jgi:competence protein ComEC
MLPFFWLALSLTAGILMAHYIAAPLWIWGAGCVLVAVGIFIAKILHFQSFTFQKVRQTLHIPLSILCLVFVLGGLRTVLAKPVFSQNVLAWYNDRGSFTLVAVVDQPSDHRETATYLHVKARELYDSSSMIYRRIQGVALIRVDASSPWQLGDLLHFTASPQTPTENADFSYRAYLERQGIYTVIYHPTSVTRIASGQASRFDLALDWLRQRASRSIFTIFPQPESGLFAGIFLGNDNDLPQATKQAYQDTGTAHIIAISGFNMAILATLFLALFTRVLNRYWAVFLSALALITYAIFVGGSPSVIRAAIMAIMAFCGHLIGRKGGSLNALGLAAGIMLAINPLLLWDASFQLSFAATAGLVLFAAPMQTWMKGWLARHISEKASAQMNGPVSEYFLFSLAAQITTLPIVALQFKRLSLTALLANPLVLPVQSAVLIAGGAVTVLGMLWPLAGKAFGFLVWPLLAYSNRVVEWLDQIPNGVMTVSGSLAVWISIGAIIVIGLAIIRVHLVNLFKRIRWVYWIFGLTIIAALVWSLALRQPDGKLHLTLFAGENGTALYLQSPSGQTLLIDPSGDMNTLASRLSQTISPWNFHLDAALLTARTGLKPLTELNDRLPVNQAILAPSVYQVTDDETALSLPAGMPQKKLVEGENLRLDNRVLVQLLASDDSRTALLISDGQMRILIPAGVDPARLKASGTNLSGLSLLILNENDIANLPADMWQNFGAQTILWNSTSLAPNAEWPGLDGSQQITLSSNGNKYWRMK